MVRKATPLLNALLLRLNRETQGFGAKSRLAREMSVAPSQLHAWLTGESEPGGEATLTLQKWVEAAESKTKRPARVRAQARQKTRQKRTSNAIKQSGPKAKT
jgi:hypothetical protein